MYDMELDYIKELKTTELVRIIENLEGYEETSEALWVLRKRDPQKALELGMDILENDKGDEFLQAITWNFIIDIDVAKTINAIVERTAKIGNVLLKDIIKEVCFIKDLSLLPQSLVKQIEQGYEMFSEKDKVEVHDYFVKFISRLEENGLLY